MHARPTRVRWKLPLMSIVMPLVLAVCGEGPAEPEEHEGSEPEVHGVIISLDGQALVTVDDGTVTGSLTVAAGEETADFDIIFTDHDGEPLTGDLSEFFADATVEDTDVAIFHSTGAFTAHIEGISAGSTTIVFHFMHPPGPDAHSNFDTPAIPLAVT